MKSTSPVLRSAAAVVRHRSIQSAITHAEKEATAEKVKHQLNSCHWIAGIDYRGLTVRQFQHLRSQMPNGAKLLVVKNTLVRRAIEGTPWEALNPCARGTNAWIFVPGEQIPAVLRDQKLECNDFRGAVSDGRLYTPGEMKTLENLPTRAEAYAMILGLIQAPAADLVVLLNDCCS